MSQVAPPSSSAMPERGSWCISFGLQSLGSCKETAASRKNDNQSRMHFERIVLANNASWVTKIYHFTQWSTWLSFGGGGGHTEGPTGPLVASGQTVSGWNKKIKLTIGSNATVTVSLKQATFLEKGVNQKLWSSKSKFGGQPCHEGGGAKNCCFWRLLLAIIDSCQTFNHELASFGLVFEPLCMYKELHQM